MAFTQLIDMYVKHNPWKFHRNPTSSKGPCFWEKGEMCFAYIDIFLCLFDYLLINSDKKIIVAVWVWHDQTNVTDSSQQLSLVFLTIEGVWCGSVDLCVMMTTAKMGKRSIQNWFIEYCSRREWKHRHWWLYQFF